MTIMLSTASLMQVKFSLHTVIGRPYTRFVCVIDVRGEWDIGLISKCTVGG